MCKVIKWVAICNNKTKTNFARKLCRKKSWIKIIELWKIVYEQPSSYKIVIAECGCLQLAMTGCHQLSLGSPSSYEYRFQFPAVNVCEWRWPRIGKSFTFHRILSSQNGIGLGCTNYSSPPFTRNKNACLHVQHVVNTLHYLMSELYSQSPLGTADSASSWHSATQNYSVAFTHTTRALSLHSIVSATSAGVATSMGKLHALSAKNTYHNRAYSPLVEKDHPVHSWRMAEILFLVAASWWWRSQRHCS